jgi:NADH-quinone oxidoreductase subunit A
LLAEYLPILILFGLSTIFGVASVYVASKMGPSKPSPAKEAPYECGITPERLPNERFPVKFYLIAMLFIIFDVEAIFLYPWAVAFRQLGLFGLVEMVVFIGLVFVAYVYVWQKGGLEWGALDRPQRGTGAQGFEPLPPGVERSPGEGALARASSAGREE